MTAQPQPPVPAAAASGAANGAAPGREPCSRQWDRLAAPLWGSAARTAFWVCVEQPGPWGVHALVESRLDPAVGAALDAATRSAGGRPLLIRAVGDRRQDIGTTLRRVYLAGGAATGRPWLLQGLIADPSALVDLPWAQIAGGDQAAVRAALPDLEPCPDPLLLVCTNGKRDRCCAERGRAVAGYAAGQRGATVWECTHTGGHRFAPTGLILPTGAMLGRLDGPVAVAALDAARDGSLPEVVLAGGHLRGLAHLEPAAQAADAYIRGTIGETSSAALQVTPADDGLLARLRGRLGSRTETSYVVRHRDGRSWPVVVTARKVPTPPASCGKAPGAETLYAVRPA